jgi:O-antigen/teichoic acid export membrane protein
MSNPIKKLLGQTAIYGLSSIVGRLLNYLLVPLYTYVFADPAHYGVVSELYAWVAFLIVLLTFGMETAFFRFLQDDKTSNQSFKTAWWVVSVVNLIFLVLLLLFDEEVATFMLFEGHNEYIILLGLVVFVDAITSLPLAQLRAQEKALKFATIQFSSIAVNIGLNLLFMLWLFDPERPEEGVLFILVANLIASLVKPMMLMSSFRLFEFIPDFEQVKRMLVYAFPLVIAGFAGIINETLDRILLKQIIYDPAIPASLHQAEAQVGIYSACYKLAMLVTILLQAYRYAAEPFFFNQMKNSDRNQTYVTIMNYFVATVSLVFLVVSLNIDIFKHFIRNESYWVGLDVVPILLLANVFLGIYYNQSIWYKLSGKTQYGAYIAIIGALLTVVINIIFIPKFGFLASAWATLAVYASQMIISYFLGQKFEPIPYNLRKFALYLFGAVGIYALLSPYADAFSLSNFFFKNTVIFGYVILVFLVERKRFLGRVLEI